MKCIIYPSYENQKAAAIQTRYAPVEIAGYSHSDSSGDNSSPMAVHKEPQATRRTREGVHQLGQVFAADLRLRAHSVFGHTE